METYTNINFKATWNGDGKYASVFREVKNKC